MREVCKLYSQSVNVLVPHGRGCFAWRPVLLVLLVLLSACNSSRTFQAYRGEPRPEMEVALLVGEQYLRQDLLNRNIDGVRFSRVDEVEIDQNFEINRVEVEPGFHEVTVFFYWDLGSDRGLAQALLQYATSRDTLSRTFRFNARAGERYTIRAQPVFEGPRRDITTLQHVNFWVEDSEGNAIVSREEGRYIESPDSSPDSF